MENATIVPPALPVPVLPRADFADWLSPMLVKELRQGVRTRVFVFLFILLQVFMLLDLVLSLLIASTGIATSEGTFLFWLMVAVPTLLIIPLGGLNAVGSEIRGNTLELIFLTRLTAFRIVVGKWFALFAQSLLLVCAVLPYLVLRYFMGGVNLASELLLLGAMLAGSALLIAVATGLSAFPTRIVRPLTAVVSVLAFFLGVDIFGGFYMRGLSASSLPDLVQVSMALICAAILILLMLDVGAARIAPPAENHSAAMRLLASVGLLVAVGAQAFSRRFAGVTVGAAIVAFIVCAVAVCEQPRAIPSLYRPFARWGWPGRIAGRFFYPGWNTGLLYGLAMFAAFGGLLTDEKVFDRGDGLARYIALLGTLLLPVALARTVFRRANRPVVVFFLVQTVSAVVFVFCLICDNALKTDFKDVLPVLPLCALFHPSLDSLWPTLIVTALSVVVAVAASFPDFRMNRQMEKSSLALPDPPRNDLPRRTPPAAPHVPLA